MAVATDRLVEDATLVVDVCLSVEKDDVVTIICDDEHQEQAQAVAEVCVERGAWPVVMNNETQVRRGRADVRFPMAPPRNLHQAMLASDAVAVLEGKQRVRVTTPLGTDFTVSIEGRPALEVTPIKRRGQMMGPVPLWAEVAFAAVEDFTHGTAVVDGVMLGIGLPGQVEEPIRWTLRGGRCVKIEGGSEAERLRAAIAGVENADVIGEFAFGTSDKAPYGTPSEKGRVGTVHLALGDNHNAYPGGQNVSSLHLDGVFLNATMWIEDDGMYILRDGEWAL
jgi:leucyl aminopeptidase (aminopeptidase T)